MSTTSVSPTLKGAESSLQKEIAQTEAEGDRACLDILKECAILLFLPLVIATGPFVAVTDAAVRVEVACKGFSLFTTHLLGLRSLAFPAEWCPSYSENMLETACVLCIGIGIIGSFLSRAKLIARIKEVPDRFAEARDRLRQSDLNYLQLQEQMRRSCEVEGEEMRGYESDSDSEVEETEGQEIGYDSDSETEEALSAALP